uniref:Uncharacterized protein n=1 Tax=Escherichia coli TaxID=562 RepID=A0A2P9EBV5_ECOLX|nr:protein of unknown function [Escherichia coli]
MATYGGQFTLTFMWMKQARLAETFLTKPSQSSPTECCRLMLIWIRLLKRI